MTATKELSTFDEAVATRDRWEREIRLAIKIEERNYCVDRDNEWNELRERFVEEYISEPLDITWHGTTGSNPNWGDAEWVVDHVDVLYGTGGPATGIRFKDISNADVWFQNWFTVKEYVPLDPTCAEWLAGHLGLEF